MLYEDQYLRGYNTQVDLLQGEDRDYIRRAYLRAVAARDGAERSNRRGALVYYIGRADAAVWAAKEQETSE